MDQDPEGSAFVSANNQAGVMATESEAVGHDEIHLRVARRVGDVIKVAFGIRVFQVDRRRKHISLKGQGTDHSFHST